MTATSADSLPANRNSSSSLRRALGLLSYIAESARVGAPTGLADLASGTGLPKSTLKRLLDPLMETGLVRYDTSTGRYALGPYTASLGGIYLNELDIRDTARSALERLSDAAVETAHLLSLTAAEVVCIDKIDSPNPVRMHSWIGNRLPVYCTASGKALLAHQSEATLVEVLQAGLDPLTSQTITTEDGLREELQRIHHDGFAVDNVENQEGIRCVGAAVFDQHRYPTIAVSVSGPTTRMTSDRVPELSELVRHAARDISAQLGATRPD